MQRSAESREGLHADLPWEFAYDPDRKSFLALEDVNFLRSVFTAVPTDRVVRRAGPLRILVLVAQPLGTRPLSSKQESELIRRRFQPLIDAGLVDITVRHVATAGLLHRSLESERFDVRHFIGHGAFDEESNTGTLLFEDRPAFARRYDGRRAGLARERIPFVNTQNQVR